MITAPEFIRRLYSAEKTYLLGDGTGELPEGSEFLGTSSSESTTEVLDGHKVTGVTVIEQSTFSDTMYAVTTEPGSEFYISADKKQFIANAAQALMTPM